MASPENKSKDTELKHSYLDHLYSLAEDFMEKFPSGKFSSLLKIEEPIEIQVRIISQDELTEIKSRLDRYTRVYIKKNYQPVVDLVIKRDSNTQEWEVMSANLESELRPYTWKRNGRGETDFVQNEIKSLSEIYEYENLLADLLKI